METGPFAKKSSGGDAIVKLRSQILATTHPDLHSERMTIDALETLVQSVNSSYIPVGIQHDPRIAPVGRVASASIRKLDDGEYAVEGLIEVFEPGDKFELVENQRTLVTEKYESGRLEIEYDRNFRDTEDQLLIEKIAGLFGTRPKENVKKSLDPITVLAIGGAFILGGVAQGFLSKLGEDAYEVLKQGLKKLFARKKVGEDEKLLVRWETPRLCRGGSKSLTVPAVFVGNS